MKNLKKKDKQLFLLNFPLFHMFTTCSWKNDKKTSPQVLIILDIQANLQKKMYIKMIKILKKIKKKKNMNKLHSYKHDF